MKTTKLLKILASLAVVASMTACQKNGPKDDSKTEESGQPSETSESTPETARVLTIAQAVSVSVDFESFELVADFEGVLATVENLTFAAAIGGNRILCQYADDEDGDGSITLSQMYGIEVELADGVQLVRADGTPLSYTDKITVTGRITLEKGKVVMKEASYEYVEEGSRRNWYWPAKRDYFNAYTNEQNGICIEGTVQVLEMPNITPEDGGAFKVVFPGEKTTLEDNDFVFEIKIPAGLSEAQIAEYNAAWEGLEVKGGLYLICLLGYENGLCGYIPYDFLGRKFSDGSVWMEVVEIDGVYDNFDDALEVVGKYTDPEIFTPFAVENAYSYIVDENYATTDFSTQSYVYINQDYEQVTRVDVTAYTDSAREDAFALLEELNGLVVTNSDDEEFMWFFIAAFDASGNQTTDENSAEEFLFFLMDKEDNTAPSGLYADGEESESGSESEEEEEAIYAQAYVDIYDGSVGLLFFAEFEPQAKIETADFDELAGVYQGLFADVMDGESALFGESLKCDNAVYFLQYAGWESLADYGLYNATLDVYMPAAQLEGYLEGLEEALAADEFVPGEISALGLAGGFYNADSHEFVVATKNAVDNDTQMAMVEFEIVVDVDFAYITDPIAAFDTAAEAMADYAYADVMPAGSASAITGDFFDVNVEGVEYKLETNNWDKNAAYGIYIAYLDIMPIPTADFNAAAGALLAKFGEGWVEGQCPALSISAENDYAYWNANTHELVKVGMYYANEERTMMELYITIVVDVNARYCSEYVAPATDGIVVSPIVSIAR